MRAAWRALKDHAKARGIPFKLPFPIFRKFALQTQYLNLTGSTRDCLTVDRIKNDRGYVRGNIQPLTRAENSMKKARHDAIRMKAGFSWRDSEDEK